MKLSYYLRDDGACGYYRVRLPIETMAKNVSMELCQVTQGVSPKQIEESFDAQLVIIPRIAEAKMLEIMGEFQKLEGKRLIIDHDDNMFGISPLSPHYVDFGVQDVKFNLHGKVMDVWTDGKNINLAQNRERLDMIKRGVEQADMVTVTTEILAEVYREYSNNVVVLPNCVDANLWNKLPMKERDDVRICWYGGHSHYEDWLLLEEVIPAVMEKYPQAKLVLMGSKWDATLKGIPKDRIEYHPWVPTPAYPYKAAALDADICVIPLVDSEFNRSKSAIKWIEQGALSVPCVASNVSPYKEMATEDNGVFIQDNSPEAWMNGISYLIENKDERRQMGTMARKYVEDNYDINDKWKLWHSAYEGVTQWQFQSPQAQIQ